MKRLVFCFDGTWNKLSADTPTNVVITAASIERVTRDGTTQIIHYDEGVGTGYLDHLSGGMFGVGLVEIIRRAYSFLIFNYDPGDEIFVFGFSRGAFTARSFVGFIRDVGPLSRVYAEKIDDALGLYERRLKGEDDASDAMRQFRADYSGAVCTVDGDDAFRCQKVDGYQTGQAPAMRVRYLGVWDTVGALGIPANLPGSSWLNQNEHYHDVALTEFVESGRHAIAIDERRALFPVTTWGDLTAINATKGKTPDAIDAPYQEKWFPGVHGSVGGGGDIRGLSDGTLAWILKGATLAGLRLDIAHGSRIYGFKPDPLAPLNNVEHPEFSATQIVHTDRMGPEYVWQLGAATIRRWKAQADELPEKRLYRPKTLGAVKAALDAYPLPQTESGDLIEMHMVAAGDLLSALAKHFYGDAEQWPRIFAANRDQLDDPDELFVGQTLRIPKL
jgi:uncharacterized protein (DUF2235 family)